MSACGDVPNGFLCVPIVFGDRALGCIEVFASEPIGFARAGEIERQAGEFGALLAMVLSTDAVEGAPRGRILIADDDAQIRALLVALLERRGFECIDVPNGWAAYEAAQRERPDLVLIDWMMPVMDGRETVARLKADPSTRDIPVVMLTGQSQIDDKVAALEAGVQDFITKPFDSRELVARVEQQLRWRRCCRMPTKPPTRHPPRRWRSRCRRPLPILAAICGRERPRPRRWENTPKR